ncbi:MAG: nickel-dependent hydrogenase large subunit [Candidatus Moduliflexus flocculans]|nr:nickel-dependent hydrogenase large subunit [Candidatus Moduliflexus flocculans]
MILANRDPWDAQITQRICGVCPISHAQASVLALDAAAGVVIPSNARILRNLVLGANFVQSHLLASIICRCWTIYPGRRWGPGSQRGMWICGLTRPRRRCWWSTMCRRWR